MTEAQSVGVDGCRSGWFGFELHPSGSWRAEIWPDAEALFAAYAGASVVLIDIPIGLPYRATRSCDQEARQRLQQRRSSVFPVPCRAALQAENYPEGCDINQAQLGVRISKQAWNIGPKIVAVDRWLRRHPEARAKVRECHPELAFYGLQGGIPMASSKKTPAGLQARLNLLSQRWAGAEEAYQALLDRFSRNALARDDILDAMVLAITAARAPRLRHLPEAPPLDEAGLPMEIVFGEWD
jgi:predicted RNase H-like nuclease